MGQNPCTIIVQGFWPNLIINEKTRILKLYYIFWYIYMYSSCIESLSWFRSKLDFLWIFKFAQKSGQRPCTIVQGFWPNFKFQGFWPDFGQISNFKFQISFQIKRREFSNFIIFWYVYMFLCFYITISNIL